MQHHKMTAEAFRAEYADEKPKIKNPLMGRDDRGQQPPKVWRPVEIVIKQRGDVEAQETCYSVEKFLSEVVAVYEKAKAEGYDVRGYGEVRFWVTKNNEGNGA